MNVDCRLDEDGGPIVVASLVGLLDADATESVWEAISALLDGQHPSLLVDVGAVELITSAGLGTLVRLHHRVQKLGGRISIFGANRRVRGVIEIVMLTEILNLCETVDEARSRVGG